MKVSRVSHSVLLAPIASAVSFPAGGSAQKGKAPECQTSCLSCPTSFEMLRWRAWAIPMRRLRTWTVWLARVWRSQTASACILCVRRIGHDADLTLCYHHAMRCEWCAVVRQHKSRSNEE